MPYYHVSIEHHDPSRKTKTAYELDLTKEALEEQIVNPYLNGKTFLCGGQPIDAFFVDIMKIYETKELSQSSIPKLREEHARKLASFGFVSPVSDEYLVVSSGLNVTRQFIKHPPIKEAITEKKHDIATTPTNKQIFIVHGTDHQPVQELKVILKEVGLEPIILHEQPSRGITLIEKLEEYSEVGFAFIILTPDDIGVGKAEAKALFASIIGKDNPTSEDTVKYIQNTNPLESQRTALTLIEMLTDRARQNVVLEFGYFIGRLGRDRVCCLYKGNIELPSDMHGIYYVHFNGSVNEVKSVILKELKAAGYKINQ